MENPPPSVFFFTKKTMETRICISIVFSYLKVEESLYPNQNQSVTNKISIPTTFFF